MCAALLQIPQQSGEGGLKSVIVLQVAEVSLNLITKVYISGFYHLTIKQSSNYDVFFEVRSNQIIKPFFDSYVVLHTLCRCQADHITATRSGVIENPFHFYESS